MAEFKTLDWQIRAEDGVVHAEPHGLGKSYFIYPANPDDDINFVELVLIDDDGHYDDEETTIHATVQEAKEHAQNHYLKILKMHAL